MSLSRGYGGYSGSGGNGGNSAERVGVRKDMLWPV